MSNQPEVDLRREQMERTGRQSDSQRNASLLRFILLPTLFLSVALLGGLRVDGETRAFIFVPPPLIALVLAALLMLLFWRGNLIDFNSWLHRRNPGAVNVAHALTLAALFFASAQAFTSVLPERGLPFWLLAFFFLWTLWNNLFARFDARTLLRSVGVLFGTAFFLKHFLFANLYAADRGWLERVAGLLLEGASLGTLAQPAFAPATGYISFFTILLYVGALLLTSLSPDVPEANRSSTQAVAEAYHQLPAAEQAVLRRMIEVEESVSPDEITIVNTTARRQS